MRYAFGQFEVDLQLFELRREGQRVRIDPKVFDLLVYLLQHRGRVVTKQELLDAVWADEHVVEAVLPTTVKRLRTVLGQSRDAQEPIATERGRGYRFVAELRGPGVTSREASAPVSPLFPREAGTNLEMPTLGADEPLVGRDQELAGLTRALETARDQRPRLRLLTGEPGVGRSRLLAEVGERARALGMQHFAARGRAGAPDMWPWIQIVRAALTALGDDVQSRLPRGLIDELAPLAPGLRPATPGAPAAPQPTPFALADAVRTLLHTLSSTQAPLVLLDDLQCFDAPSLELLALLADEAQARRPFLVAAVCEQELAPEHPAVNVLATLERAERVVRVPLHAFGRDDVRTYLNNALAPQTVDDATVTEQAEQTAGLPFALRHVARAMRSTLLQGKSARGIDLPDRAREPARRRLRAFGSECVALLRAASVVGESFDLALLVSVTEGVAEDVLQHLERALEAGVIVADGAPSRAYRFANRLLRDTLYIELAQHERRRLHRAAADALERRALPTEVETHAIAHHFHSALPSAPVEKVVHYSMRAAQISEANAAYPRAAEHYTHALDALGYATQRDATQNGELLIDLARVQLAAGNSDEARGALEQALALAGRGDNLSDLAARAQELLNSVR